MQIAPIGSVNFIHAVEKILNNVQQFDDMMAILLVEVSWNKPRALVTTVNESAKVLQQIKSHLRSFDNILQIDNNLFGIIIPEIFFLSDAHIVADRLLHALEVFYNKGALVSKPIISLSTAISGNEGNTAAELYQAAKKKTCDYVFKNSSQCCGNSANSSKIKR